ncbi:MAG TPA: right-handed parallel beta-helix repeat-containing protein, partial [Terriglobales bacterium]
MLRGALPCFIVIALLSTGARAATTYYVSSGYGDDSNDGRSMARAWKTLGRVNGEALAPGDTILLRRGDAWEETLKPSMSGAAGKRITFGAYGDGARPVISGSHVRESNIDNNEQSHIVYQDLDLRNAQRGLRLYSWSRRVEDITLQDSLISTGPGVGGWMSAGVYVSVHTGRVSALTIRRNTFWPYPKGLMHWGVYFVQGASDFRIQNNRFGPAGEDAICIWHSENGVIASNRGGGNGENTVDVKDSQGVRIENNFADNDGEYNIVVHSVDGEGLTSNVVVARNRCVRGGQGGSLSAGIA